MSGTCLKWHRTAKFWRAFFFFRSTKLIFRALPSTVLPQFWLNFLRRRQIFKKTVKKAVFGHFLKIFDKKNRVFFGARSPSKLVYIGAKGAFRKILGSVGQKWISDKVSKGGPFGSAGGRIPEVVFSANRFEKRNKLCETKGLCLCPSWSLPFSVVLNASYPN